MYDKEYPYLPCELVINDVTETEIIFGVLKLNDGTSYPFPIIYYKKVGVAVPLLGVYECLCVEGKTAEDMKAAFDTVPMYYESMKEHWTDECNKVLGVEFYPVDVK